MDSYNTALHDSLALRAVTQDASAKATVTLFVAVYNMFARLLHLFGRLGGDD